MVCLFNALPKIGLSAMVLASTVACGPQLAFAQETGNEQQGASSAALLQEEDQPAPQGDAAEAQEISVIVDAEAPDLDGIAAQIKERVTQNQEADSAWHGDAVNWGEMSEVDRCDRTHKLVLICARF